MSKTTTGLRLHVRGKVPAYSIDAARAFVVAANRVVDVRHRVPVLIAGGQAVKAPMSGRLGFGAFCVHRSGRTSIWIAGIPVPRVSREEHAEMLCETIAHELVHYEQWRDGKPLQERGVAVRARAIIRALSRPPSRPNAPEVKHVIGGPR